MSRETHNSNNLYNILGRLDAVTPKEAPVQETKTIYESVEAKGSMLEGVNKIEAKLAQQFAEGKDEGKPGKNFAKIAKKAAKEYGSKEAGNRVAGAIKKKVLAKEDTISERSVSQAQAHMMAGAAHDPAFAKKVGVKQSVAKEFNKADTGKKMSSLPKKVGEGEAFVSDDVWNMAKRISKLHGVPVDQFGAREVDEIADQVGLSSSDVAEILELTTESATCSECGMNEGTCEHTMTEASYVHKGTYGTEYNTGDEDKKPAKKEIRHGEKGRPKKEQPASYDAPKGDIFGRTTGEVPKGDKGRKVTGKDTEDSGLGGHYGESVQHTGTYGTEYYKSDDFTGEKTPKVKSTVKGRPKKDSDDRSSANLPWGGKPPKDTYKPAKGGWGMRDGKKFVKEGINFAEMMKETHQTVDDLMNELQQDIKTFKDTGHCSDTLSDIMKLHGHIKKKRDMEEAAMNPVTMNPMDPLKNPNIPAIQRKQMAQQQGKQDWKMGVGDVQDFENRHKDEYQKRLGNVPMESELNELAKLAGLSVRETPVAEESIPVDEPTQAPVNAPKEKYAPIKAITTQGDDLNRPKKQFASKPFRGDNPMTAEPTLEAKLQAEYDSIKLSK